MTGWGACATTVWLGQTPGKKTALETGRGRRVTGRVEEAVSTVAFMTFDPGMTFDPDKFTAEWLAANITDDHRDHIAAHTVEDRLAVVEVLLSQALLILADREKLTSVLERIANRLDAGEEWKQQE